MTSTSPALHVEGLTRSFGDRLVVDGIGLDLHDGEMLTLVGPSGCGKSTLLRLIAGLEPIDAGRVLLGDRDVTAVAPEQRHIGFVFQESSLFGHLRVDQNVAFGLRHLPRAARAARVAEMLELVHLGEMARRYPHQLSGGEQQRIALARALAPSPRVVLLDEPFASLDELLREELRQQVAGILRATRTASILVTHDRHEAMSLGDRVAVMRPCTSTRRTASSPGSSTSPRSCPTATACSSPAPITCRSRAAAPTRSPGSSSPGPATATRCGAPTASR